jgi:hypothetical protein
MATSIPARGLICSICAKKRKLEVLTPCPEHPNPGQTTPPVPANIYLYNGTLQSRSIRLLQLEPGKHDDVICCKLTERSLDEVPSFRYNALSYCWGDDQVTTTIICDGRSLSITKSLFSALQQFRDENCFLPLWTDAVCINQANDEEKTAQAQMMLEIYQKATVVIAWLGNPSATDESGFMFIKELYNKFGNPSLEDLVDISFARNLGVPKIDSEQWKAFCGVLYKPYFFRVWIIQEVLAARRCIVQCGPLKLDRSVVLAAGGIVDKYHHLKSIVAANAPLPEDPSAIATYYSARDLWFLKSILDRGAEPTICQLLYQTRMFQAKKPLDKIFALIALCSNVPREIIDYRKTLREVQIDITKMSMEMEESFGPKFLSNVDSSHHGSDLPSWVVDWTNGGPIHNPFATCLYDYSNMKNRERSWRFRRIHDKDVSLCPLPNT